MDSLTMTIKLMLSRLRYLDVLLNIDNPYFQSMVNQIYPPELQLNKANTTDFEAPFLSHLLIAGCDIGVQISVRPFVRPSCPSIFTSKFDIYVKVFVFSASVIAVTMKTCIVIVLDILFKHTP